MIRHIPSATYVDFHGVWKAKTYCGRIVPRDRCIDNNRESIEMAECKSCQRLNEIYLRAKPAGA